MPTDDERREVARKLRDLSKHVFHPDNTYELLAYALGVDDGTDVLFARLADLIEPQPTIGETAGHECVPGECPLNVRHDSDFIDRAALLALADAMEEKADDWDVSQDDVPLVHTGYLTAYAERIRKALGIKDEDPDLGENFCDGCEIHCDLWSGVNCPYECR